MLFNVIHSSQINRPGCSHLIGIFSLFSKTAFMNFGGSGSHHCGSFILCTSSNYASHQIQPNSLKVSFKLKAFYYTLFFYLNVLVLDITLIKETNPQPAGLD